RKEKEEARNRKEKEEAEMEDADGGEEGEIIVVDFQPLEHRLGAEANMMRCGAEAKKRGELGSRGVWEFGRKKMMGGKHDEMWSRGKEERGVGESWSLGVWEKENDGR
ncbi:hypothetical protein Dimus_031908, partial [Dionaea muscipula]